MSKAAYKEIKAMADKAKLPKKLFRSDLTKDIKTSLSGKDAPQAFGVWLHVHGAYLINLDGAGQAQGALAQVALNKKDSDVYLFCSNGNVEVCADVQALTAKCLEVEQSNKDSYRANMEAQRIANLRKGRSW